MLYVLALFFDNKERKDINEFASVVCCAITGRSRRVLHALLSVFHPVCFLDVEFV